MSPLALFIDAIREHRPLPLSMVMEHCPDGSLQTLWNQCDDARTMLQLLAYVDRRQAILGACTCARTTLQYVPTGERAPSRAIETAERWAWGETDANKVSEAFAAISVIVMPYYSAYSAATCAIQAALYDAYADDFKIHSYTPHYVKDALVHAVAETVYAAAYTSSLALKKEPHKVNTVAALAALANLVRDIYPRAPNLVRVLELARAPAGMPNAKAP